MRGHKYRGNPAVLAHAAATAAGDSVVANIPAASSYMKDIMWQWAKNEAMGGRAGKTRNLLLGRLDSASAYVDVMTGAASTTTGTHVPQDGVQLAAGQFIDFGAGIATDYSEPEDFAMFIVVSEATRTGSSGHGLLANNDGDASSRILASNASDEIGGVFAAFPPAYIAGSGKPDWVNKVVFITPATNPGDGAKVFTDQISQDNLGGNFNADAIGDTVRINSGTGNFEGSMTFVAAGVVDADVNFDAFARNLEMALDALTRTAPAFSNYFEDGDSLQITDVSYQGMVSYMQNQPGVSYSDGGRSLADIAGSIDSNLALQAVDDVLIGAGTNDINIDSASEATVTGYIDDIVASFQSAKSAGDVNQMIMRTLPPFRGVWFPNYWTEARQATTEAVNAYLLNDVAQIEGVTVVDIYATLDSSKLPTYIKGDYYSGGWMPSPDSYTHPDDPNYSFDGLHLNAAGAQACADLLDYTIRELRYYKGGRV